MRFFRFIILIISLHHVNGVFGQDFEWAKPSSGLSLKEPSSIIADINGHVITSGIFDGTFDADPGTGNLNLNSNGDYDVFIQKLSENGNILWAHSFGGSDREEIFSLTTDHFANIYLSGRFYNTVDFDLGVSVHNVTASVDGSAYLLKMDSLGNFIQVITWEEGWFYSMAIDENQYIYATGDFDGDFDADPGAGIYMLTADSTGGSSSSFILKLSPAGNMVWANNAQCNIFNVAGANSIVLDGNGNLYTAGWFQDSVDFNPGLGVFYLSAIGVRASVIQKQDTSGNFIWAKNLLSDDYASGTDITIGPDGNVYSLGMFGGNLDIDPGPSTQILSTPFSTDYYVIALTPTGNYSWSYQIDTDNADYSGSIELDTTGNIFVHGYFSGYLDFDPGPATVNPSINTLNGRSVFILKLNNNGTYADVFAYGGELHMFWGDAMDVDSAGNIYTTALFYEEMDFDPSPAVFTVEPEVYPDIISHKMSQITCSFMSTRIDSVSDVLCVTGNGYASVLPGNGSAPYTYSWNTSPVTTTSSVVVTEPGIYTVTVIDDNGCERESSVIIKGPRTDQTGEFDLVLDMFSTDIIPGSGGSLWIDAYNAGCVPVSGEIVLKLSEDVDFVNAVPYPDFISSDTLKWFFTDLTSDSVHRNPRVDFLTHDTALAGRRTCFKSVIVPLSGDMDTTNNRSNFCIEMSSTSSVVSKLVDPLGACISHLVPVGQQLTYTLLFQNTGTDTIVNISILDEVDYDLDINSINILGSSHYVIPEILPGNYISFRFDSIMLADQAINFPQSFGYVSYTINPLASAIDGTAVMSQATFNFDSVLTITSGPANSVFVDEIPDLSQVLDITLCPGDTFQVDNHFYTVAGIYFDKIYTVEGCDSTITTLLDFYAPADSSQILEFCYGETYDIGIHSYSVSGIYMDTLVSSFGCDSIVTTNLTIKPQIATSLSFTICPEDSILVGTTYYKDSGSYSNILPAADGCDSTIFITINHHPSFSNQTIEICKGESYSINNNTYFSPGIYNDTLVSAKGCDSIVVTDLDIIPLPDITVTSSLYTLTAQNASGTYQWINCSNMFPIKNETNQSFTAANNGNYAVIVTDSGCSDTSSCEMITGIGLTETESTRIPIRIYPNPNAGHFFIQGIAFREVEVYDIIGQLVCQIKTNGEGEIMLNDIPDGIYMLNVKGEDKYQMTRFIIMQ